MEGFAERLRAERERLGMTQARFAEACGVGKTAQYTYERGDRLPTLEYVDAAATLGVDLRFLLRGERESAQDSSVSTACYLNILLEVSETLGLDREVIPTLRQLCSDEIEKSIWSNYVAPLRRGGALESFEDRTFHASVAAWLRTARRPDACLDLAVLSNLLKLIDDTQAKQNFAVSAAQRASAAASLYRLSLAGGVVDEAIVREALNLTLPPQP